MIEIGFYLLSILFFQGVHGQQISYNQLSFFLDGPSDYTPTTFSNYIRSNKGMYLYENQANLILTPAGSATTPLFDSSGYLDQTSYTISGWFYTCQTGDYHIISRQKASTTFNEIFSIRVDGTGQLIVHYLEGTLKTFYTGIYTYAGWNYFALAVKQYSVSQFGTTTYYNDLNFYSGNDQFPSSDQNGFGFYAKIQKFTTTWQRSVAAIQKDFTYTDTKLMIGCRQYEGSTAPELYTGFMHGFIHSFRIYNQAVGLEILSQDWSTCGMCSSIDKQCYDKIQDLFVAKMDFAAGISNNLISDSSGNSNILELSPNPPIQQVDLNLLCFKQLIFLKKQFQILSIVVYQNKGYYLRRGNMFQEQVVHLFNLEINKYFVLNLGLNLIS